MELYGRLRDCGLGDAAELALAEKATAAQALEALARLAGAKGRFVEGAVLATESEILAPGAEVPAGARLAALPPVSGG